MRHSCGPSHAVPQRGLARTQNPDKAQRTPLTRGLGQAVSDLDRKRQIEHLDSGAVGGGGAAQCGLLQALGCDGGQAGGAPLAGKEHHARVEQPHLQQLVGGSS